MSSWLLAFLTSSQVPYELLALVLIRFFLEEGENNQRYFLGMGESRDKNAKRTRC